MACLLHGSRVALRVRGGSVARALRCAVERDHKSFRSVFSLASARTSGGRPLPSSLSWGRCCISATTTSRGYAADSEAGKMYRSLELSPDGKKLCVSWADGEESTYHAVWLRHNCRCPQCWDDRSSAPTVHFDSLRNVEIKTIELSGDGDVLNMRWGYSDNVDEHTGYFPLHYLRKNSYSARALQRRRDTEKPVVADHLPTMAYPDIVSDEKYQWMWLKNLNVYGMCLVTDMPAVKDEILKLADCAGGAKNMIYGETYTVDLKDNPDDLVYTTNHLPYHLDASGWSESPPGLHSLHCLRFDDCVEGGESLLLDLLPVLEELRGKHPQQFEILTTYPATYTRTTVFRLEAGDNKVAMERQKPHIILDRHGEVTAISLQPSSEGPLFIEEDKVEAYYDAYCLLQEMMITSKYQHKLRLKPGQTVTLNNRRCVHSRTAMKLNGGVRRMQGALVSSDDLKSKMRILARKCEPDFVLKRSFNLDPL